MASQRRLYLVIFGIKFDIQSPSYVKGRTVIKHLSGFTHSGIFSLLHKRTILCISCLLLPAILHAEPNGGAAVQMDFMSFDKAAKVEPALMATFAFGGSFTPNLGAEARLSLNALDILFDGDYQPDLGQQFPVFKSSAFMRFTIPFHPEFGVYGLAGGEFVLVASRKQCRDEAVTQSTSNSFGITSTTIKENCTTQSNGHSGFVAGGGIRLGSMARGAISFEVLKRPQNDNGFGYTSFSLRFSKGL